ncbi:hypothetical protein [Natronolimnohabitans innermongolicus]|uniref:Uncharacterized protein n=1 Tax=Natronolimnohabitans innermongolicus JCM 12255 TaxID=1227499 RepID=L9WXU8_9EURY|nr:hypothetical protein [Natronolimnohabitans innermongolicus]ELY53183.1 hypothetical protein C493_14173 [Natronolimnohabitans innermongolicus JCM 12255]
MSESDSQRAQLEPALSRSLSPHSLRVLGRVATSMLVVGLVLGLTSYLSWIWIEASILPEQEGTEALIVEGYTPLVYLLGAAVAAPVVGSILGFVEGRRVATRGDALVVGVGCLIGAIALLFAAGVFIGATGGGDSAGPGPMDLLSLAGLSALSSGVAAALLAILARETRSQRLALPRSRFREPSTPDASNAGEDA